MKNPLLFLIFFFIILVFLIILSCEYFTLLSQKEWAELSEQEDDVVIYVGGWYTPSLNYPCYWKITEDHEDRIDLEMIDSSSRVYSIYVQGDNVYTCGNYLNTFYGFTQACYWINGKIYLLDRENPGIDSEANDIYVKNGIVFTTGTADGVSCFWVNQEKSDLNLNSAHSIFIQQIGSSKHVTYIGGQSSSTQACYWKDGIVVNLPGSNTSFVNSINVVGNTVYSCGIDGAGSACFWINNKLKKLTGISANSIFVSGEDIYIAGLYNATSACYWKNGKYHLLPSNDSLALSIFVFNNKIYIAGEDDTGNIYACYWVDGKIHYLHTSSDSTSSCIFVVPDNKK